jgi:hypothetical protein
MVSYYVTDFDIKMYMKGDFDIKINQIKSIEHPIEKIPKLLGKKNSWGGKCFQTVLPELLDIRV